MNTVENQTRTTEFELFDVLEDNRVSCRRQQSDCFVGFQDYYVVLLSPSELDPTMKLILQVPIWAARVIYIQGSALKDSDLSRCRFVSNLSRNDLHILLWNVPFDAHCCHIGTIKRPVVIGNFWHLGTLTRSPEHQSLETCLRSSSIGTQPLSNSFKLLTILNSNLEILRWYLEKRSW